MAKSILIALTVEFFAASLPKHGFEIARFGSSPFDNVLAAAAQQEKWDLLQTDGDELLLASKGS